MSLEFCSHFNAFTGKNGSGKTNLLDAVHYICTTKSYFNRNDQYAIRFEENSFVLRSELAEHDELEVVAIGLEREASKKLLINGKQSKRMAAHLGKLPIVMIAPSDISIVNGASVERRRFLDRVMSQTDTDFLSSLMKHNRLLDQRNAALKMMLEQGHFEEKIIESFDSQLGPLQQYIHERRQKFIKELSTYFQEYYAFLSDEAEEVHLEYESDLQGKIAAELLKKNYREDYFSRRTSAGIHRDDLLITLASNPLKRFGSQGQIKTCIIALQLASFSYLQSKSKYKPILLLDDIFEKIDLNRSGKLMKRIGKSDFGQVFITDTNLERLKDQLKGIKAEKKFFNIGD